MLGLIINPLQELPPPSTTLVFKVRDTEQNGAGILFGSNAYSYINERALRLLEEFKTLKNNWDEDGALAPNISAIRRAEDLVKSLRKTGQKVFHVAPGPSGEIMVDLRKDDKSVEIIFYSERARFVKFPAQGNPEQGTFDDSSLTQLLKWLNG